MLLISFRYYFSHAGDLKGISSSASIPVMSTMGHSGQLLGPALLGGVAEYYGISASLLLVAFLMLLLCVSYYIKQKKYSNTESLKEYQHITFTICWYFLTNKKRCTSFPVFQPFKSILVNVMKCIKQRLFPEKKPIRF